jgi:hypothetical protein
LLPALIRGTGFVVSSRYGDEPSIGLNGAYDIHFDQSLKSNGSMDFSD